MMTLEDYGWSATRDRDMRALELPNCVPGRVVADHGGYLRLVVPEEIQAELSGKLRHFTAPYDLPKIGDWVAVKVLDGRLSVIEAVLPRHSEISRKLAGRKVSKQVLAVNIDVAFVVQSMDHDFNPKRLQRFLFQVGQDKIRPVVVLNKADLAENPQEFVQQLEALDIRCIVLSAKTGEGMEQLINELLPGQTAVLLGSSGVGKSTLINWLIKRATQKTQSVRINDQRGKHTTTHRELFVLENGSLLIDSPGIRELQLWGTEEALDESAQEIAHIAAQCRFANCTHGVEPDCAIRTALESGVLSATAYANYQKMKSELQALSVRSNPQAIKAKKKGISSQQKQHYKEERSADLY